MGLEEHRGYLADANRVAAYARAIQEVVRPGSVVLDLGCGTGVLGLLACRAGAARVYAVDESGMIEVARRSYEANGFAERVSFIHGHSTAITLPERVDVVVADQIGAFAHGAGLQEVFADARARFLKPRGRAIPSRIELYVALVEHAETYANVDFWSGPRAGFDFTFLHSKAVNKTHLLWLRPADLLGDPARLCSFDPTDEPSPVLRANFTARRSGTLHGLGGWFTAQLAPGVRLTNSPLACDAIQRRCMFLPIERPVPLAPGSRVRVSMDILPGDDVLRWKVRPVGAAARDAGVPQAGFSHSTFQGMLTCKDEVERSRPEFVPKLVPLARARRLVYELCDGRRTRREIEEELRRRLPKLFRTPGHAQRFVTEIISRESQ
jgi:protein arginine N-methyltransferase 1